MNQNIIHYQAANQSYEQIIENFVVRKEDFNKVINDIKNTEKGSSFQHYIFVGRRGSGKSTLLRRIEAEINTNKKLKTDYEIVNLGEEQSGIYKLYDLWDNVIRDLNTKAYEIEEVDFRDYRDDLKAYSKKLHSQIITAIRAKKKKRLILLIDNIDRIFKNIGDDSDLFRELLMNYLDIRIIGGSTYMSEQFWKYENPFYQFFSIRNLGPLTKHEIEALFRRWSVVKNLPELKDAIKSHPGKLKSIRMLTDGTPRSMLIFVDMLLKRPNLKGYDYLKVIVDKATPIYQERLGTLSPAQNKIITELAYLWESSRVKELIPKCKMDGKTISALLNQLYKLHYVEKIKGNTKDLYYRIEERFFNLWLIMTQGGPQQKLEAKYLSEFLETWYNQKDLNQLCQEFNLDINKENHNANRLLPLYHALLNAKSLSRDNKLELSKLKNEWKVEEQDLGAAELYLGDITPDIDHAFTEENYRKAIDLLKVSSVKDDRKYFGIGLAFHELEEYKNAENYYLQAIEKGNVNALYNLAILYKNQEKYQQAENYYLLAFKKGNTNALEELVNMYYFSHNKSRLRQVLHENTEGIKYIDKELLSICYLFIGQMEAFKSSFTNVTEMKNIDKISNAYILHLLIHNQIHLVEKLLRENELLQEKYKPLFYSILQLKESDREETLRIPPELLENIDDILSTIKVSRDKFYGPDRPDS